MFTERVLWALHTLCRNRLSLSWRSSSSRLGSPGRRLGGAAPPTQAENPQRAEVRDCGSAPRLTDSRTRDTSASQESFRGGCHHGGGLGSARTPLGQAGSGSVLPLREERGIDEVRGAAVRTRRGTSPSRWGSSPFCPALTPFSHRRTFLQAVSSEKVRCTNLNCSVIADVRHDGSEPCVDVLFGGSRWESGGSREPPALAPQSWCLTRVFPSRRRPSLDYARRSPDRPGNAHCFRLPHPGQGPSGERGQAERQHRALTAQKRPVRF